MTKQTIAIVGPEGSQGSAIARKLAVHPHYRLLLIVEEETQPDPRITIGLPEFNGQPAAELVSCLKDGCWEADIILVDIPFSDANAAADRMKEVATQKIIFVFSGAEADRMSAFAHGQHWQTVLPNSKVVTGYREYDSTEVFFTGQDSDSVRSMTDMMNELGYQSIILHKN